MLNISKTIENNLPILYTNEDIKKLFPPNSVTAIYTREKNLKEILFLFLFIPKFNKIEGSISNCNKCNICKNYLISNNTFRCNVTGRVYSVRGSLSYSNPNLIYFISRKNSGDQYEGSVTDFQASFRIHKNYVKTKKGSCATANHFNNRWWDRSNPHIVLQVHFIESVQSDVNLEGKLWERQCQLFTNTHGINGVSDLYSSKRKGCRKN